MSKETLQIVYHGTNEANAKKILKHGFKIGTYFATHLEDSLGFGGNYVFEVAFPSSAIPKGTWQFTTVQQLPPRLIVQLTKYGQAKKILENELLGEKVFISNLSATEKKNIGEAMREAARTGSDIYSEEKLRAWGIEPTRKAKGKTKKRKHTRTLSTLKGVR